MASDLALYSYSELPPRHIRLLTIQPDASPVSCTLSDHSLDENLDFDALSYAWGTLDAGDSIICADRRLHVHHNLFRFLHEFTRRANQRPIWIDAICIHQSNNDEKSIQVPLMREIYRKAKTVVSWLGEATAEDSDALDSIPGLVERLSSGTGPIDAPEFVPLGLPDTTSPIWPAIGRLYHRPYWRRLWILQEMVLPRHLEFWCGIKTISSDVIVALAAGMVERSLIRFALGDEIIEVEHLSQSNGFESIQSCEIVRKFIAAYDHLPLGALLNLTRRRQTGLLQDKIFAILGLASPQLQQAVSVDYAADPAVVYTQAAKYMIQNESTLTLHLLSDVVSIEQLDGLPSWCPNFASTAIHVDLLSKARTAGYCSGSIPSNQSAGSITALPDSNRIAATGLQIDKISTIIESWPPESHNAATLLEYEKRCLALSLSVFTADGNDSIPDAHWRTLIANESPTSTGENAPCSPEVQKHYLAWKTWMESRPQTLGADLSDEAHQFYNSVVAVTRGRTFFSTRDGRIGLGPPGTREGDLVCVVYSSPTPYILREKAGSDERLFGFVGEAYVHGIMYGEALGMETQGLLSRTTFIIE
ncbi:hypothetical protein MMC24_001570 [Lignoscripta atroalba]|nr:hypothetical protein [Lignoscripta atroalba]